MKPCENPLSPQATQHHLSPRRQPEHVRQGDGQQLPLPPSPCSLCVWGGSGPPPPARQLTELPSPLVLQDGGQVAGLVPRGSAGVDDVGAGSRGQEEGGEAAGLQEGRAPSQEQAASTWPLLRARGRCRLVGSHRNARPSPPATGSLCPVPVPHSSHSIQSDSPPTPRRWKRSRGSPQQN